MVRSFKITALFGCCCKSFGANELATLEKLALNQCFYERFSHARGRFCEAEYCAKRWNNVGDGKRLYVTSWLDSSAEHEYGNMSVIGKR